MNDNDLNKYAILHSDGVITLKNPNTTVAFVRFNDNGEIEYVFVNPIFRKRGLAKKLINLVKYKTGKKIKFQEPISPLGTKLINSLEKVC